MRSSALAPAPLVARAACALGLASLALLTLIDQGATRMYALPWWRIYWLMHGAVALALLARATDRTRPLVLPPRRWVVALGASAGVALAAALQSPYRGQSILAAATPLAAIMVFILVFDWLHAEPSGTDERQEMLARGVGGLLGATVLTSIALWTAATFTRWSQGATWSAITEARNAFPLGHTNYTAGLALLALPWCAGRAGRARGLVRGAWGALAALSLVALFTSGSRGGLLGLAAMAAAALFLARLGWRRVAVLGALVLGVLLLLIVANPRVRSLLRARDPFAPSNQSDVQRSAMLVAGLRMGGDRPLLGWGPGVTPWAYPRYRADLEGGAENVLQLHCLPVQVWADAGAPGLLCFVGLGGLLVASILRHTGNSSASSAVLQPAPIPSARGLKHRATTDAWWSVLKADFRSRDDDRGLLLPHAAMLAFAGYGVFALTDFQLDVPVFAAIVATCGACLAPPSIAAITPRARGGLIGAAVIAVVAVAMLGRRDPTSALNAEALTLAREPAQAGRAIALLCDSLARNPHQEIAHFNLGWLLLIRDPAAAERHFFAAAHLVPDKGGVYFGLGLARLNRGDPAGAAHAWALECLNDPLFLTSPWWRVEALAAQRGETWRQFDALLRQCESRLPPDRWLGRETRYTAALGRWLSGAAPASAVAPVVTTEERGRFFSAPSSPPAEPIGAIRTYRRERTGYPVLMKNLDVPPPVDLFDVQEDPRMADSLRFLFPGKGWLPSPWLLEWLEAPPPAAAAP